MGKNNTKNSYFAQKTNIKIFKNLKTQTNKRVKLKQIRGPLRSAVNRAPRRNKEQNEL